MVYGGEKLLEGWILQVRNESAACGFAFAGGELLLPAGEREAASGG